jgi:hypothetical protein
VPWQCCACVVAASCPRRPRCLPLTRSPRGPSLPRPARAPQDGANTNNILEVLPREAAGTGVRERLLSRDGLLAEEERAELAALLCPWGSHDAEMHRPRGAVERAAEAAAAAGDA